MRKFVLVVPTVVLTVVLWATLMVPAVAAPAQAARAGSTAGARPLPSLSYRGVLLEPAYEDIWTLAIGAGQQAIIEMVPPDGEDFRLALFPPGTTDTGSVSGAVASSMHPFEPQALKYVATSSGGGTYYIDVWSAYKVVDDGSYTLEVDLQSPTNDVRVTAPDVPKTVWINEDYTSTGTLSPRHFPGDESITLEWQKYGGGRWRSQETQRVENEDYGGITRYTVEYSFFGWGSGKMKWRVRAVHRADELHPRQASAWRTFWVKM